MANATLYRDNRESQARAHKLTCDMLQAMIDVLGTYGKSRPCKVVRYQLPRTMPATRRPKRTVINSVKGRIVKNGLLNAAMVNNTTAYSTWFMDGRIWTESNLRQFEPKQDRVIPNIMTFRSGNKIYTQVGTTFHYVSDDEQIIPEHRAIMIPQNDLEGYDAIRIHLGEIKQPKPFVTMEPIELGAKYGDATIVTNDPDVQTFVRGTKVYTTTDCFVTHPVKSMHGSGLSNLDKIIYNEAGMTGQGDACLPHEDHSRRAWWLDASQIRKMLNCTVTQAETLKLAFEVLDTTPKMAEKFREWLSIPEKFNAGFVYFDKLAGEMAKVTDIGEPGINDDLLEDVASTKTWTDAKGKERWTIEHSFTNTGKLVNADNPADIETAQVEAYHLLDDPRDDYEPWEKRQPKIFQNILAKIRTSDLTQLKAVGKELFGEKRFTKTQMTVIWDEYHRRKNNLTPKLRPVATKILRRLADPDVNLSKAAAWLHGKGKTELTAHELSVVWEAWRKVKASRAPKQSALPV
jgi:hypothetical protein